MNKALITGAGGFIGHNLSEFLLAEDWQVIGMDYGTPPRLKHSNYTYSQESVLNLATVNYYVQRVDAVFHLAAQVGVDQTYGPVTKLINEHFDGDRIVFEACAKYKVPVLFSSTSECYGKNPHIPWSEDADCVLGTSSKSRWSYAASKLLSEHLALAMYRSHNLDVRIVRLFNITWPGQSDRFVLPRFAKQAVHGQVLTVYGDGQQKRTFCDIRDCVPALYRLMIPNAKGQIINIGSQQEITMLNLAKDVILYNKKGSLTLIDYVDAYGPNFDDMQRRLPDLNKIKLLIGWEPTIPLGWTIKDILAHELQQAKREGICE